jgi:hypothetical protein
MQAEWWKLQDAVVLCSEAFKRPEAKLAQHLIRLHPNEKHWLLDPDFEIEQLAAHCMVNALTYLRERHDGTLARTQSLETLVCLFQGFASTAPRDEIYALLNLAKDRGLVATGLLQEHFLGLPTIRSALRYDITICGYHLSPMVASILSRSKIAKLVIH